MTIGDGSKSKSANADCAVLIAGAGPVGLLVALELAHHGVGSVLIDRALEPTKFPKMDITNGRSMELFRRLGFADRLRSLGVAPQHAFDVLWAQPDGQPPFARWDLPSVEFQTKAIRANNDGTMPLEADQRSQQSAFEKMGRELCRASPLIDFREGCTFETLSQDDMGVDVIIADAADHQMALRASYLVGADGAGSRVRRALQIGLEEAPSMGSVYMVHFRSADLETLHQYGRFWHYYVLGSVIICQDERETWTFHTPLTPEQAQSDLDPAKMIAERIGLNVRVDDVLLTSIWQPRFALAERYSSGRVFLAGDAVHQVFPTGGYGMNTGVGDAIDIGWKLAAMVNGWAGEGLLDSYEAERRPVGARNRDTAMRHLGVIGQVVEKTMAGDAREEIKQFIESSRGENEFDGIEFGYRYTESPVIAHESGNAPPWSEWRYVPSTWPGARPPSFFLEDGSALFDHFGKGFTLVDFTATGQTLVEAARAHGIPMTHLPLTSPHIRAAWERDLVLIRPDQHVAWRGNSIPEASAWRGILDLVSGKARH